MAIENENGNMVMPVAPMYGGNNGAFGLGDGNGLWFLILFFLLCGGGMWGGMGGFGGWGGMMGIDYLYPWLNNSQQINDGFRDQMITSNINGIQNAITSGFGDVQLGIAGINQNICSTGNGIVNAVNSGFNAAEVSNNARQIANMQQAFVAQTANMQGFNGLQNQLSTCCCNQTANTADLKYTIATENCADRAAISDGIRDLLAATQAQTQTILTQMCNDKIEQKNDTIAQLRSELLYARGQASQDVQTAAIQAGQRNLANEVEQYVAPRAVPAYVVANPACCQNYTGCGCGVA